MNGWGSASSPILYKDLVIVTAAAESESLVALNQETGKEVWRYSASGFSGTFGTPVVVDCGQGRSDLAIAVPGKIWGINPDTGKLRWSCAGLDSDSICTSAIAGDGTVYAVETGPRGGGAVAVRAGGEGDVSKTHVLWQGHGAFADQHAGSGEQPHLLPQRPHGNLPGRRFRQADLPDHDQRRPVCPRRAQPAGRGPVAGQRAAEGRRAAGLRVAAAAWAGRTILRPSWPTARSISSRGSGDAIVYAAGAEFKLLAQNHFAAGSGDFSSTPAISDGQLFIRSSKFLYCVAQPEKAE